MLPKHKTIGFTTEHSAIFQSSIFSEIRGSIGGTTYARNKSGLYARNRSIPVNPNTVNQSIVRSRLSGIAQQFSNLTAPQVAAWNQFAQGYPAKNKLGDTYTPTGKQVYMLCNLNLGSIARPFIQLPPYDTPIVPGILIDGATVDIVLELTPPQVLTALGVTGVMSDNTDALIVYQFTPVMQASRQSYRNLMRQLGFTLVGDNFDALAPYIAYFGSAAAEAGQVINVRVAAVDPASGVSSSWVYLQGVVPTGT